MCMLTASLSSRCFSSERPTIVAMPKTMTSVSRTSLPMAVLRREPLWSNKSEAPGNSKLQGEAQAGGARAAKTVYGRAAFHLFFEVFDHEQDPRVLHYDRSHRPR